MSSWEEGTASLSTRRARGVVRAAQLARGARGLSGVHVRPEISLKNRRQACQNEPESRIPSPYCVQRSLELTDDGSREVSIVIIITQKMDLRAGFAGCTSRGDGKTRKGQEASRGRLAIQGPVVFLAGVLIGWTAFASIVPFCARAWIVRWPIRARHCNLTIG